MAETFTGKFKISAQGTFNSSVDIGSTNHVINYLKEHNITSGSGADQANMLFTDTRTLSASSSEDLDLAGGLTNAFGTTITFTGIKYMLVVAAAANTNDVIVGGASSNQFINWVGDATDTITVGPGNSFSLTDSSATGFVVTAGTGDLLKIANSSSGTSVTYDIVLIGEV